MLTVPALLFAGLLHVVPLAGILGGDRLRGAYGVEVDGDVEVLLRHRAVLFGVFGAGLWAAVLRAELHVPALVAAWVAMASFMALARGSAGLRRVWLADLAGVLVVGAALVEVVVR
ncbi:MAG: phosphopantetheine adenylyltransferase [Deltaproteobacteria bacterium]|nr:MAG: phosphopantetheine adenylyltransferase [Deltaproteobacteria bacterium]